MKDDLNNIMQQSYDAFLEYQLTSGLEKKAFLYAIADEIEALGDELLQTASEETNLPLARFAGERMRTCGQMRSFGDLVAEGSWVEAVIDGKYESSHFTERHLKSQCSRNSKSIL